MIRMKQEKINFFEISALFSIYLMLFFNDVFCKDSIIAVVSAFFGITYTIMAGKGRPVCYLFGVSGSALYGSLAFDTALWGNLILYTGYYIRMQVLGFFRWNKHLKADKKEIVKTRLNLSDLIKLALITLSAAIISIIILILSGDKSPYIDGITTVFSVAGMYLTVKRCIEQWLVWLIVNGLSFVMWLKITLEGEKVYSTVLMWGVYFILAIYFYIKWKQDIFPSKYTP